MISGKKWIASFIAFYLFLAIPGAVFAEAPYQGYVYDAKDRPVAAPNGYMPEKVVLGADLSTGGFNKPQDVAVDVHNNVYIADTGNNRIVKLDAELRLLKVIDAYTADGKQESLKEPSGIFVDGKGRMYIADTGNGRIVVADQEGGIQRVYGKPDSSQLPDNFAFDPFRIVVDSSGIMYVLTRNSNLGMLMIDRAGGFLGFYGTNRVQTTLQLLSELFWRNIMTKEQISRMKQFTPLAVSNLHIDRKDFIYTVTAFSETGKDQIRKLGPDGSNVLRSHAYGDRDMPTKQDTAFIDITSDDQGFFYALDQRNGRVFQYDQDNNLLFIFGGKGSRKGAFQEPAAIEQLNGKIIVLDSVKNSLTVFAPTSFALLMMDAVYKYNHGMYEEALEPWKRVLERSGNFDWAHVGIGKALFNLGEYKEAMRHFKLGNDRDGYSKAKREHRTQLLREHFEMALLGTLLLGAAVWYMIWRRDRRKEAEGIRDYKLMHTYAFPFYILFHPVDGYQELVWNKKLSVKISFGILALFFLSAVLYRQELDFTFNMNDTDKLNIPLVFMGTVVLFAIAAAANWCFCTLMDGEGKFKEIWVTCSYALLPYILASFISIVLSRFFIAEESFFIEYLMVIGKIWSFLLVVAALKVIHDYTVKTTLFSIGLTVSGMMVIMFLSILGYALYQQVYSFAGNLYSEMMFRWN